LCPTTYSVHPGGIIEPGPKPADCTPAEAALCLTTSVFATTVTGGSTKTTGTSVTETCATITGCNFKDVDATTTANACTIQKRAVRETNVPEPGEEAASKRGASKTAKIGSRAIPSHNFLSCAGSVPYGIIWSANPRRNSEQDEIRTMLTNRWLQTNNGFQEIRASDLGFTAFWVVNAMDDDAMAFFNSDLVPQIYLAYHPENPVLPPHVPPNPVPRPPPIVPRSANNESAVAEPTEERSAIDEPAIKRPIEKESTNDETVATEPNGQRSFNNQTVQTLSKRAIDYYANDAWHISMLSWGPNIAFDEEHLPGHQPANNQYFQSWDDSYGEGQTIYILERFFDLGNPVSLLLLLACVLLRVCLICLSIAC
jgi:chitinase